MAKTLAPLVGKTEHFVKNSKEFVDKLKGESVEKDEELRSYDVTALLTCISVDKALVLIREHLEKDSMLKDRTPLEPSDVVNLLELYLRCTYFVFQGSADLQSLDVVPSVTDNL